MAKITKVPNGPLIKKKGPFKGSTLKSGGVIKKAATGSTVTTQTTTPPSKEAIISARNKKRDSIIAVRKVKSDSIQAASAERKKKSDEFWRKQDSTFASEAEKRGLTPEQYSRQIKKNNRKPDQPCGTPDSGNKRGGSCEAAKSLQKMLNKSKNGGMIKRADGSMSKRGLWDNIRANKGSGKKPTKQMLVQEKKIKAKSKK